MTLSNAISLIKASTNRVISRIKLTSIVNDLNTCEHLVPEEGDDVVREGPVLLTHPKMRLEILLREL